MPTTDVEPTTDHRAHFLRWLAQGEGMTQHKLWLMADACEVLFGSKDGSQLEALIASAYRSLVPSEYRDAIGNALAIDYEGPDSQRGSLSERREHYRLARGLSPRTVIRHEDKGAVLLAKQIEITPAFSMGARLMWDVSSARMTNAEIKSLIRAVPRLNDVVKEMCAEMMDE